MSVLVVDDDEEEFVLAADLLETVAPGQYATHWTPSYEEALHTLQQPAVNVALIDYQLGIRTGLDLIGELVASPSKVPLILLTGQGDREIDSAALAAGATDYLDKRSLTGPLLDRSLRYAIGRRRAADALRRSDERFRALFDISPSAIYIANLTTGLVEDVNAQFEELTGYRREHVVGRSIAELELWVDTGVLAAGSLRAAAQGVRNVDLQMICRSGERRHVLVSLDHLSNGAHREPLLVAVILDVTEQRAVETQRALVTQELTESEHLFRALAHSIAHLAWMAAPDGRIYWYNDQWYAYTGATPGEMEGAGWERVHDPAVLPDMKQRWEHTIRTGTAFEMIFPIRAAEGTFRRFLTRANPVRDSRGKVVHWFGTNTDVEEERRATEANVVLREREQLARHEAELQKRLLHSLFMQAPTLIAVLRGPEHVVELANPPVCDVWGRTQVELLNRPLFDAMPELRDQVLCSPLRDVYRTGVPYVGTETPATFDRGGGLLETVYFNFVYSPFRNIEGDIEGIFVVASNVTEQVFGRNQVDDLREAAEAANSAKDEFLAMLGHELRNPLSPILTALHLMKLRGDESSERERTIIERQVNHLTRLVDDLLDVSRIVRGQIVLKREVVEIAKVVATAIEMSGPILESRAHTLSVDVPRESLTVQGDPTRLSQVVSNLLTNAAKYTAPGGHITMRADQVQGDVVLRVRDTGMGITRELLPSVFDMFVQARQAIDRSEGGLGLGLAIVRTLVECHGGSVSAHSDGLGHGSEFVITLPQVQVTATERGTGCERRHPLPALPGMARILIVDDNEDGAEMLSGVLQAQGYVTSVAHDGPAALRAAALFNPDIAVLDIGLPVMDGYELGARLREVPGLETLRLVALTGYGQESDRARTHSAGFQHHLVKPVNLDTIGTVLTLPQLDDGSRRRKNESPLRGSAERLSERGGSTSPSTEGEEPRC
jgi:PAS domain S-box-containing protein